MTTRIKPNGRPNELEVHWGPLIKWLAGILSVLIVVGITASIATKIDVAVQGATIQKMEDYLADCAQAEAVDKEFEQVHKEVDEHHVKLEDHEKRLGQGGL